MWRRRWANLSIRHKVLVVLAVPIAPLVISAVLVTDTVLREWSAQDWVFHTLDVKTQIRQTLDVIVDSEALADSVLLADPPVARAGLQVASRQTSIELARLRQLVSDNPIEVGHVASIEQRLGRLSLPSLVEIARPGSRSPASIEPALVIDRVMMDTRRELAMMQSVEDRLLVERIGIRRQTQTQLVAATLAGAVLGLIGGVIAAAAFTTGIVRRIDLARRSAALVGEGQLALATPDESDEVGELNRGIHRAGLLLSAREGELRQRIQETVAVNRELEAFSYSVSHDLRAPLRHITGFASLLERTAGGKLDDEERRRLYTISEAAARMGRLIDDLLAFSRMSRVAISKRRVRLNDLVVDAQEETQSDVSDRDVRWAVQPLPDVEGDPAMLRQVFVNLISNALKYTRTRPKTTIEIGASRVEDETVVFIRDNGVGFDMQYADKLFGVFSRLHSADDFEGTGIGLASVRRIVNRHGGRTWAEGAEDVGATFYFSLPEEATT